MVGDLIFDLLARTKGEVSFGTDTFTEISAAPGGSGANAAAWLACSGGVIARGERGPNAAPRPGVEIHLVARVGDDPIGRSLAEDLRRAGVVAHLALDPDLETGKVFVLVDGAGERTMVTDRGAGEALSPDDLPADVFAAGHLHLSGYTFSGGSRRETAMEALRLARDKGITISVDPSSVPLLETVDPGRFLAWTGGADLCFPNLEEGALLAGHSEPDRIAATLLDSYRAVVLKLGPDGALYTDRRGERVRLAADPARVIDTTGAGDALCAGFLAGWVSLCSPAAALRLGVELAARAVERVGGRPRLDRHS